jgi:hypothetical protein
MSTPPVAAEAPKQFNWKRLFIKAAGFGAGFALMLAVLAGVGLWYWNRPKPPKPWDTQAITAEYIKADVEGDKNTLVFSYTLQNNTDLDYRVEDASAITLGAKLKQENSISLGGPDSFAADYPIFIPAHGRTRFRLHLPAYPYENREKANATDDEEHDFYTGLAQYLTNHTANLDGFFLFDNAKRIEIIFPSGWQKRASEQLRVPKLNKK